MGDLFATFSDAIEGAPGLALLAAFVWGILSILLSPCHLASIPLLVGFISEQGRISGKKAFLLALLFASGILLSIAAVGVATAAMGRMIGDIGGWVNYMLAVVFVLVGLHFFDIIPMPFGGPGKVGVKSKGLWAAFVLGLIFGMAMGPCTFAFMMPVLGVALHVSGVKILYGIALVLAYGVGHCTLIVLAGTFTEVVQKYLNWNEKSRASTIFRRVCGALVILAGLYYLWTA